MNTLETIVTSSGQTCGWKENEWLRMSNAQANHIARESLKTAVMQLMAEKPLEAISVTELVHRAGLSRSAFYRNYTSKEALVEDVCRQIMEEVMDLLRAPQHRENRAAWFADIFRSMQRNAPYFTVFLDTHMQFPHEPVLETVCPSDGVEDHYQLVVREGAFMAVLKDWFRAGMKETPEEMGRLCDRFIPHGRGMEKTEEQTERGSE